MHQLCKKVSMWRGLSVAWIIASLALTMSCLSSPQPPRPGGQFQTLPPGSVLPSDAECARRVDRNSWEPRPSNNHANMTTPPGPVVSRSWGSSQADALKARVTGAFTGTTDEILQWASCKWGFDVDITRAQAVQESNWYQSTRGDGGVSFGLLQIKSTYWGGTAPWSAESTAFNVDWSLGLRRACFEGLIYGEQSRGDLWGCVGAHFTGLWMDQRSQTYVQWVKQELAERTWLEWPSLTGGRPPE